MKNNLVWNMVLNCAFTCRSSDIVGVGQKQPNVVPFHSIEGQSLVVSGLEELMDSQPYHCVGYLLATASPLLHHFQELLVANPAAFLGWAQLQSVGQDRLVYCAKEMKINLLSARQLPPGQKQILTRYSSLTYEGLKMDTHSSAPTSL